MIGVTDIAPVSFLSTPSARRATIPSRLPVSPVSFLSTPSARRATCTKSIITDTMTAFLSTPSARRATRRGHTHAEGADISIHALREEGDPPRLDATPPPTDFYPRPPRGGRPAAMGKACAEVSISIHALREEGDPLPTGQGVYCWIFLSTPSARRATLSVCMMMRATIFLSTPSARRATAG